MHGNTELTASRQLERYLTEMNILNREEIDRVMATATERRLAKDDFFLREGQQAREVAFLTEGLIRSYYTSSEGEEITYCFQFPGTFITGYSSFITGRESAENMQAMTPASMLVISKTTIQKLSEGSYNWQVFLRSIAEQQYIELENRVFQLQKEKAGQRYRTLIQERPGYVREIPLQYLASYLGITQRHLSRLRSEVRF